MLRSAILCCTGAVCVVLRRKSVESTENNLNRFESGRFKTRTRDKVGRAGPTPLRIISLFPVGSQVNVVFHYARSGAARRRQSSRRTRGWLEALKAHTAPRTDTTHNLGAEKDFNFFVPDLFLENIQTLQIKNTFSIYVAPLNS